MASNKLKIEEGKGTKDKNKMKEEKPSSSHKNFTVDENLDQMTNLIKDLASKMTKLELENRPVVSPIQNEGNRNQAPFRRPIQPQQILQFPRRNPND